MTKERKGCLDRGPVVIRMPFPEIFDQQQAAQSDVCAIAAEMGKSARERLAQPLLSHKGQLLPGDKETGGQAGAAEELREPRKDGRECPTVIIECL
jgi:hypothetical protein